MTKDIIKEKVSNLRGALVVVALLSSAVNLLMLTGPIFMLQVYDRVLASQSIPTLIVLFGFTAAMFTMLGLFDYLRSRVFSRVAHWLDKELSTITFRSWMVRSTGDHTPGYKPVQDLATMRGFITSPTILALFDLPWFPIYLAVVFMLHTYLGLLATFGALVVIILAIINAIRTSNTIAKANQAEIFEQRFADQAQKSAASILAMGMLSNTATFWGGLRNKSLAFAQQGGERSQGLTATSKSFRMLLQSSLLALGAYLAIKQEISAGTIVAGSIIAGRALAPIDQTLAGWRAIKGANFSRKRLRDYLAGDTTDQPNEVELPEPTGNLSLQDVVKLRPQTSEHNEPPILSGIGFDLKPGDGLGVIGPSASGKTTLAKLLVGLTMPDNGSLRIDGATFEQWQPDDIGPFVGYLPQEVSLLSGTIAQNISRFDPEASSDDIIEAAKLADVHDIILSFADGYSTNVDSSSSPLTGGQKQRISLACAVYKDPVLLVLDEPNSNLDAKGDEALANAIVKMRKKGSVVIVMAHRPSAIASVDKLLILKDGQMTQFGDKAEILQNATRNA